MQVRTGGLAWTIGLLVPGLILGGGTGWQRFVSASGWFRVEVPGKPSSTVQKVASPSGPIEVHLTVVDHERSTFAVGWSEWTEAALKAADAGKRLDAAREGAVASAKGKLLSEKALDLQGWPGREVLIEGPRGRVRTRIYAADKRLYQVMVVGNARMVGGRDADRFLASFRLDKLPRK